MILGAASNRAHKTKGKMKKAKRGGWVRAGYSHEEHAKLERWAMRTHQCNLNGVVKALLLSPMPVLRLLIREGMKLKAAKA